jgi:hypothetical protein
MQHIANPLLDEFGDAASVLIEWMPDSLLHELPSVLEHLLNRLSELGESLQFGEMAVYCWIVASVAKRLHDGIAPFAGPTLSVLLACMELREPRLVEDAMVATVCIAKFPCPEFTGRIIDNFLWAQASQSPVLVETSATCICHLFTAPAPVLVEASGRFVEAFARNLEDDVCTLQAKREIVFAFGQIILGVGPPAIVHCEFFLKMLVQFSRLRFDVVKDESDKEIAPGFYQALVSGYTAILRVAEGEVFLEEVIGQFRVISSLLDRIGDAVAKDVYTNELIVRTMEFVACALELFAKRVNQFLTHKSVKIILAVAWEELHIETEKFLLNRIRDL